MKKRNWLRNVVGITFLSLGMIFSGTVTAEELTEQSEYQLEQMLIFSRHNIRAPLSAKGSTLDVVTPNEWIEWTGDTGELSLRGGTQETAMGQYFRKYLVEQGFMEENWLPQAGEVRFYSNSLQRTIATAQYFASGMLPVAGIAVEHHMEIGTMDPVFNPVLTNIDDAFIEMANEEVDQLTDNGLQGAVDALAENFATLEYVLDFKDSEYAKENGIEQIPLDDTAITYEEGKEPAMSGGLKLANAAADACILQYYEEADDVKAAFGHEMEWEQWRELANITATYQTALFGVRSVAVNVANPLLKEIRSELSSQYRKFTFLCGHDSNVEPIMTALDLEAGELEQTVSSGTPIGVKIVFEKWTDKEKNEYLTASLVYQSTEQLRSNAILGVDNPPVWMPLTFEGLEANEDGMYLFDDVLNRFDEAIEAYNR